MPYTQVDVVSAGDGKLRAELKLEPHHCNLYGTMAGAMACTLVDVLTSYSVMTAGNDPENRVIGGVSLNINVSYFSPAKLGETIVIDCSTLRKGKSIQFMNMDIFEKSSGRLVCRGEHIHKAMMQGKIEDSVI